MSLINQMLRDLDAREAERSGVFDKLKPLPAERKVQWQPAALAVGGALIGAALVWVLFRGESVTPTAPVEEKPAVRVEAAPALPISPALPPPAVVVVPKVAVMPAEKPAGSSSTKVRADAEPRTSSRDDAKSTKSSKSSKASKSLDDLYSLKIDGRVPLAPPDIPPVPSVQSAPPPSAKPAVRSNELSMSGDSGQVDKRTRTPQLSEAAENDYRKAMAAYRRGATAEAIGGLKNVLLQEARHVSARQALLSLLVEQKSWQEAIQVAEEGLRHDPAQSAWAMILARMQLEHRSAGEAIATLGQFVRHAERNPEYQAFYALLLHKQQRSREAAERYALALALRPDEARWWFGLGLALENDQRPQEARNAFQRARDSGNLPAELSAALDAKLK
jgi:MSHA biogenesis protein MshN